MDLDSFDWVNESGLEDPESLAGYKSGGGGGGGGYAGTPGWYTFAGHHHCTKGQAGCVCTDPKKCIRTGNAPTPAFCRPDHGRYGPGPCSLCPGGKGGCGGPAPTGGATGGTYNKGGGAAYPGGGGKAAKPKKTKAVNTAGKAKGGGGGGAAADTGGGGGGGGGGGSILDSIPGGKQTLLLVGGALVLLMVMGKGK